MKTTTAFTFLSLALLYSPASYADTFGSGLNTFDIEFVTIGNPGNADDTTGTPNPAGKVDETYRIGKFEISRGMIQKANTEGGLGITLRDMTNFGGNGADRPATGPTWFETTRFVNWLNTDSGSTPAYKFDPNGNFQLWQSGDAGYNPNNLYRNSLATYFLPSMDEWYKAAYYDPNDTVYYDYPTGSDTAPTAVGSGTWADTAVYGQHFSMGPANITLAGGLSPYGTMGQGGNVWEWEETDFDLVNDSTSLGRGLRGGVWDGGSVSLLSLSRLNNNPNSGDSVIGFRVASIPEPYPGDFDNDGDVDGADFLYWQRLRIGLLSDWILNYGTTVTPLSATSAVVPEPTTCVLALAALCLAMSRHRSF